MEILLMGVWAIWKTRNAFIFNYQPPNLYAAKSVFKEELQWLKFGAK
jgi:hypothetical protein